MFSLGGRNILDIGANDGDTTLNLAVASGGGSVLAFEMGPHVKILRHNVRLNPGLHIDVHAVAISNKSEGVNYQPDIGGANCQCDGCCGGIADNNK